MCGLCGVLGLEHHWTATASNGQSADVPARRRERALRIAGVNRVLAPTRLSVSEWQGVSYIVSTATGKSEVADNLAQLWACVERLRGVPFDPLDIDLPVSGEKPVNPMLDQ